jgi:hypothetical protein
VKASRGFVGFLTTSLMCLAFGTIAQLQDNFTDGDFTTNPTWSGEPSNFTVDGNRLHLNAPAQAATAYLSTPCTAIHEASWEFSVEMGFATSSTSLTRVYLVTDQADLKQALNGYFVMIGNTDDEVSLYRQTGTTINKIIDGLNARVGAATVLVKVNVTRDAAGLWTLFVDVGNTGTYTQEAVSVTDITHTVSNYMGVYCLYTATRSTLFWFDDFVVSGSTVPDTTPPSITGLTLVNVNTLRVDFSEAINSTSGSYAIELTPNSSFIPEAQTLPGNSSVNLVFDPLQLTNGLTYSLEVLNVTDLNGNVLGNTTITFLYFIPTPVAFKDIIISECMADPSPFVGLPEVEFIELYNRSANPVNLENWKLSDGSATATLPLYILMPASYITITTSSASALFNPALGVANFPSLNNTGDNIILKTELLQLIDSIHYSIPWYHSEDKQEGGWSLEIIDPENLCEEEGNWTASENSNGGTPGTVNSVNASNPDLTAPVILSGIINSTNEITIVFNEKLDGNSTPGVTVEPSINVVAVLYSANLRQLKITTAEPLVAATIYTVTLSHVFDCPGNPLIENSTELVLPEATLPGDIVLNEILFNPKSGGADFIEVYNTSNKYISFKKWSLANLEKDVPINMKGLEGDWIISPKGFRVFTSDPVILKAHYPGGVESTFFSTTLPSLSDDAGSIAFVDSLGTVMDFLFYEDDYHTPFLKDKEGVSLERVSVTAITNDANNWHSASQQENFATPGYKNSASSDGTAPAAGEIIVEPEIFSPQVPPIDFTTIHYRFKQSGKVVNAQILDQQGHRIKTLANNEVLGTEGFFRWDGDRDDGGRARAGYYVAWLEVFDANGQVNTFRKRVVVYFP